MSDADALSPTTASLSADQPLLVERQLTTLNSLLANLEEAPLPANSPEARFHNQLVQVRLGLASSLFAALRVRHAPTADHSLRVAMGCSSWAVANGLSDNQRDTLEVAALLHDIGKVGVPDMILRQPTALTSDQALLMHKARDQALHILACCCAAPSILNTVAHVGAWFDGSRPGFSLAGDKLPIGARMIAIVDAFDAMTTDRIYRKAMPRERAIAELFSCAGTQFDPHFVNEFAELQSAERIQLDEHSSQRWLSTLTAAASNQLWRQQLPNVDPDSGTNLEVLFHEKLFESMHDGVVYVDPIRCIVRWNRGAERLTGISSDSVYQRAWTPKLLMLRDSTGCAIPDADCPVGRAIDSGTQLLDRFLIKGRKGDFFPVDFHVVPIFDDAGMKTGATILLRDASSQSNLEKRVQTLHEKATRDPLTGVSNRAEFNRFHEECVQRHLARSGPCSLIICDIDRFKRINDTHGHQAGDAALVSFAALLQRSCRAGDMVARYGGEEFVVVCEDCHAGKATQLAERIRLELSRTPLSELNGQCITASFGVTELQPGDSPETMLRRADRGLLQAKDTGRNRVVQLGSGMNESDAGDDSPGWWRSWFRPAGDPSLMDCYLSTNVPMKVVAQKLRGFVADHDAEIVSIDEQQVVLRLATSRVTPQRRRNDRPIPFLLQLDFSEQTPTPDPDHPQRGEQKLTVAHVTIRTVRHRDRRAHPMESARGVVKSLRSYLMAQDYLPEQEEIPGAKAPSMLEKAIQRWSQK